MVSTFCVHSYNKTIGYSILTQDMVSTFCVHSYNKTKLLITWYLLSVFTQSIQSVNLSFTPHISSIVSKARSRCAVFLKSFLSRDTKTMLNFFTTYVRPILEFSSSVCSLISSSDINKLENVQKYFTNKIQSCTCLSYHPNSP